MTWRACGGRGIVALGRQHRAHWCARGVWGDEVPPRKPRVSGARASALSTRKARGIFPTQARGFASRNRIASQKQLAGLKGCGAFLRNALGRRGYTLRAARSCVDSADALARGGLLRARAVSLASQKSEARGEWRSERSERAKLKSPPTPPMRKTRSVLRLRRINYLPPALRRRITPQQPYALRKHLQLLQSAPNPLITLRSLNLYIKLRHRRIITNITL